MGSVRFARVVLASIALGLVTALLAMPAARAQEQPKAGAPATGETKKDSSITGKASVSEAEKLQFLQKNAQAQLQELQERMYRLAELTREAEPDDAAKLLMAVRKAREQLIIEQMKEAYDLLGQSDLADAVEEQKRIIVKLEELKKLLLAANADLQMQ